MRGPSRSSSSVQSTRLTRPTRSRKRAAAALREPVPGSIQAACRSVIERLEQRQLLAGDGFIANFYNTQITDPGTVDTTPATYSTHLDTINFSGNTNVAPPDAPAGFTGGSGKPGDQFTTKISFQVVVPATGFYTFFPKTDDGAALTADGTLLDNRLPNQRGPTEDPSPVTDGTNPIAWNAGETHQVSFYMENGGGGWDMELRWSATSVAGGGTTVITKALVPGTGATSPIQGVQTTNTTDGNITNPGPQIATAAPTIVSAAPGEVTLSWSNHDIDACSYIVARSETSGGPYTDLNDASPVPAGGVNKTDFYKDTTALAGHTYYYVVISNSIVGQVNPGPALEPKSPESAAATTTDIAPATPVVRGIGNGTAAGSNNVSVIVDPAATSYDLLQSTTQNGTYTQVATAAAPGAGVTTLTLTDTTATANNGNLWYEVVYHNPNASAANQTATSAPVFVPHGDGWAASFFQNNHWSGTAGANDIYTVGTPDYQTIDKTINFTGGNNSVRVPETPVGFNNNAVGSSSAAGDNVSGEWDANFVAPFTDTYTFFPRTDDGVELVVDGVNLDDQPTVPRGLPGLPGDVAAVATPWAAGSTHSIRFLWTQFGGGYGYQLRYATTSQINAFSTIQPGGAASASQVVPQNDAYVPVVGATDNVGLSAPRGLVANVTAGTVLLTWNSDSAENYNVYRSLTPITSVTGLTPLATVAGNPYASPGVAQYTYTDTAVTNGTLYYYAVTGTATGINEAADTSATNVTTEGAPSLVQATPNTVAPAAPAAPIAVPFILTNGTSTTSGSTTTTPQVPQINVTFTTVPFATSYIIQRAPESAPGSGTPGTFATVPGADSIPNPASGNTVTFTDTDPTLVLGNKYFYQIIAVNGAGSSPASASVTITTANGSEAHYYNQHYWRTSPNTAPNPTGSITAPASGVPVTSTDEAAYLSILDAHGTDGQAGVINTVGSTTVAKFPDPKGVIGPDNFSDVFTGKITVPIDGLYTIGANTDDQGILFVGGTLVSSYPGGHGESNNEVNVPVQLKAGTYDYQFFQANGGGGWGWHMVWNVVPGSPPTLNTAGVNTDLTVVPSSDLAPVSGPPAVPTGLSTTGAATQNANGTNYTVPLQFNDNSDSEIQYLVQRSTDPTFGDATKVVTIATLGIEDNGAPDATTGAVTPLQVQVNDASAPANSTLYYRVIAKNYDGSSTSTATTAVVTGATTNEPGIEVNYYNNQWWKSTNQSTTAPEVTGIAGQISPLILSSDETSALAIVDAHGTDGSSGVINTGGTTSDALNPDPNGTIGPDQFSTVFTGSLNIVAAGLYTLYPTVDDDGYLYVDDQLVAADPGGHGPENPPYPVRGTLNAAGGTVQPTPITLSAGKHNIEMFHSNGGGGWDFHLFYDGPDNPTPGTPVIVPTGDPTNATTPGLTTQLGALVTPGSFTATASADPTKATLTWANNNTAAIRYVIQRSTDPAFPNASTTNLNAGLGLFMPDATGAATTGSITFNDTGLSIAQTYYYRIATQNYEGTSAFTTVSPTTTVTTPNSVPPVAIVTATENTQNQSVVSFPASSFQGQPYVNSYLVTRTDVTAGGSPTTVATLPVVDGQTGYTVTDTGPLTSGHTYSYQVVVQNTSGSGPGNSAPANSNALLYLNGGTEPANHPTGFTSSELQNVNPSGDIIVNASTYTPSVNSNGQLQLAETTTASIANSVYQSTPIILDPTQPFETSFDFQFGNNGNNPADGFTFVIQGQGPNAVGGGGGALGYDSITPSLAVAFNFWQGVSQIALAENGARGGYTDIPSLGVNGNAFHEFHTPTAAETAAGDGTQVTDVFQSTISLDPSHDATTGSILHLAIRDATTGRGYSQDFTLPAGTVSDPASPVAALFGPTSQDYIGFTAGTGGAFANQYINDWVFNQPGVVQPNVVQSVGITDNPTASPVTTANQRSQVRGLVVTFASSSTLTASQLSLSLLNSGGSGLNDNSAPTPVPNSVFGTPTNPSGDGKTWVVPFVASTPNTSATGSLNDGIYTLNISGVTGVTSLTFHRLFGDIDGNRTVNALDYSKFKNAFGTSTGATTYNADLDFDNNGTINALDYSQFKSRFGKTFTYA